MPRMPRTKFGPAAVRPHSERPADARLPLGLRFRAAPDATAHAPGARSAELAALEAVLLFADEPLAARRLGDVLGFSEVRVRALLAELAVCLDDDGTAFRLAEIAQGYQLLTRPEHHRWLARLRRTGHDLRLTPSALETLAVIAYRQPIMRADVEGVRGVQCGETIRLLMERGLVRVAGRHDSLGRPQLYATTKKFLQAFGLNALADLPEVESLRAPGGA